MADNFESWRAGLESPAEDGAEITPNDDADLGTVTRGIYVGGSGDLTVDTAKGTTLTFVGLAAGIIHPIRARRVRATGTDATDIVGVY